MFLQVVYNGSHNIKGMERSYFNNQPKMSVGSAEKQKQLRHYGSTCLAPGMQSRKSGMQIGLNWQTSTRICCATITYPFVNYALFIIWYF